MPKPFCFEYRFGYRNAVMMGIYRELACLPERSLRE
jgi:hypothetical protein